MKGVWWGLRRSWKSCEIDCRRVTGRWMSAVLWHHADLWWRPADTSVPDQPFKWPEMIMLSQITMSDMRGKDYDWLGVRCFGGVSGQIGASLWYLWEKELWRLVEVNHRVESVKIGRLCSWWTGESLTGWYVVGLQGAQDDCWILSWNQ